MNEVVKQENSQVASESAAVLSMIERLALDPNVKIETVEKMIDLQERILKRNAEQAFAADFAAMQCELPRIARNGQIEIKKDGRLIQSTKFAKLEDINDGVRPTLQKYGFGVSFSIEQGQGGITVTAKLLHRLGHSEKTSITLPIDNSGSKNSVQGTGSTISYGKRYAMSALLNISTGDDMDGHNIEPEQKKPQPKSVKQAITDARLDAAIAKIKSGEYTTAKLFEAFTLTDEQYDKVMDQCPETGAST